MGWKEAGKRKGEAMKRGAMCGDGSLLSARGDLGPRSPQSQQLALSTEISLPSVTRPT